MFWKLGDSIEIALHESDMATEYWLSVGIQVQMPKQMPRRWQDGGGQMRLFSCSTSVNFFFFFEIRTSSSKAIFVDRCEKEPF